jgi:outer membrane protein
MMIFTVALILYAASDVSGTMDLSGWVAHTLTNSPTIAEAEATLSVAGAGLRSSGAFRLPVLSFTATSGYSWSSYLPEGGEPIRTESESYSAALGLSQEIIGSGGRNWLLLRGERAGFQAAEADYRAAVLDLVMSVVEAYYAAVEAEGLLATSAQALERSASQLERAEALYQVGGLTTLELLQLQVQESRNRLSLTRSRQNLRTAYTNLYRIAGLSSGTSGLSVDTLAVLRPIPPDRMAELARSLDDNPTLEAARFRARQSSIRARAQERSYWPSLSATASWNWSDNSLDGLKDMSDNDSWSVGLRLNWTIFDGYSREAAVQSARASALRTDAGLAGLEISLAAMLQTSYDNMLTSYESYTLSELVLHQAQEQYRLSRLTYDMGGLSLLELLDAQQMLTEAQAGVVSSRVACLVQEARVYVLAGRLPRLGE